MTDPASDDDAEARRRGQELQAALPKPHRTTKQLVQAEIWLLLVAPLGVLWFLVWMISPNSAGIGFALFFSLVDGSLAWVRIKGGMNRGTRWG